MQILALNGAAQKSRNTATMLKAAFDGSMSVGGAQGEFINLYDLDYTGCIGCHECKRLGGKSFGRCAVNDSLSPVLDKAIAADVLLLGSPMYFSDITGKTRMFLERFLFPAITYERERRAVYPKRPNVGWVFTCNAPGEFYTQFFQQLVGTCGIIGNAEYVCASQTQQFEDYSQYAASMFDVDMVKQRHMEVFPKDCQVAFEMGKRLATQ